MYVTVSPELTVYALIQTTTSRLRIPAVYPPARQRTSSSPPSGVASNVRFEGSSGRKQSLATGEMEDDVTVGNIRCARTPSEARPAPAPLNTRKGDRPLATASARTKSVEPDQKNGRAKPCFLCRIPR